MKDIGKKFKGWLAKVRHRLSDPFRLKELDGIKEQMKFWHNEVMRELDGANKALENNNMAESNACWKRYKVASARYDAEVTDKLRNLKP